MSAWGEDGPVSAQIYKSLGPLLPTWIDFMSNIDK